MSEKKKKNHRTLWLVVLCMALIGCIVCTGYIGWHILSQQKSQSEYEKLKSQVKETEIQTQQTVTLEEVLAVEFDGWTEGKEPALPENVKTQQVKNPVDFQKLQEINSDIYAWIEIPNTKIDYPIAQNREEDSFYLSHNMYREPEFAGCIYTEKANSKKFTDPNTLIYGHNMKNGSMFQNLHLFAEKEFFEKNQYVYIYTPKRKRTYKIFAAYEYDDRHILNSFDFQDENVFGEYLKNIMNARSMNVNLRSDIEITEKDKILTLSTCVGGKTNARYLVQAVLQNDEKTK